MSRRDELIKQLAELRTDPKNKRPLIDDAFLFKGRNGQKQGDFSKCRQITITIPHPSQKHVCTSSTPVENKSGKKGKRRLLKIISLIGLSGVTVLGTIAMVVGSNKPASLDDVLAMKTPASLGLDGDTQKRLSELKARANQNDLKTREKIELVGGIIDFKKDIIKSKIVYAFDILGNPIYTSDISLIPEQVGEHNVQIVIDGIGTYEYEEEEEGKEQKYTISGDIKNYITNIVEMQGYKGNLENGVGSGDFQEKAKESLDNTDIFAAGEIEVDENGNITIEFTKRREVFGKDKQQKQNRKLVEEAEANINDDGYDR